MTRSCRAQLGQFQDRATFRWAWTRHSWVAAERPRQRTVPVDVAMGSRVLLVVLSPRSLHLVTSQRWCLLMRR